MMKLSPYPRVPAGASWALRASNNLRALGYQGAAGLSIACKSLVSRIEAADIPGLYILCLCHARLSKGVDDYSSTYLD